MHLRIWATLPLLGLAASCNSEKSVRLADSKSGVELLYGCDAPEYGAQLSAEQNSVLLTEAGRIIRLESDRGNLDRVEPVQAALASGDLADVELAVVGYGCAHGVVGEPVFPEPGSLPPPYQLAVWSGADPGASVSSAWTVGRPVILMFWASWCPPCRDGYPELQQLARDARDREVDVYAVVVKDSPANINNWVSEHGGGITFLLDEGGRVERDFRVRGVPSTYVIGADGKMRSGGVGYAGADSIRALLDLALGPAGGN